MRRLLTALAGVAVIVVVVAGVWFLFTGDSRPGVSGLAPAGPGSFDGSQPLPPGPSRALYSPNGTRLAVLTGGRVALATGGRLEHVTVDGSRVVDMAWFPNSETLLVAEGPTPTGALAVVDIDGTVRGSIPLDPSVGFGSGWGMSVHPEGRRAILTAVTREPLDVERRHLVEVDLETGSVRDHTPPGGPDEFDPHHLADGSVVYSTADHDVAGVVDGTLVVELQGRRLLTSTGEEVGELPEEARGLADLAPGGDRAVIVTSTEDGQPRLREITLRGPRPR